MHLVLSPKPLRRRSPLSETHTKQTKQTNTNTKHKKTEDKHRRQKQIKNPTIF